MNNGGPGRWGEDGASKELSTPFPIIETDATVSRVGGVCGADQFAPFPSKYTEGEGYFESPRDTWTTSKSWLTSDVLDAEFEITAHHKGYIEVSLCVKGEFSIPSSSPPTMECFNKHILEVIPNTEWATKSPPNPDYPTRYNLPPACHLSNTGAYYAGRTVRASFKLPSNLSSLDGSQGSMLRWRYVTSNSCYAPGTLGMDEPRSFPASAFWDELNDMYAPCNDGYDWFGFWHNMGVCGTIPDSADDTVTTSPFYGEEFVNCADVRFAGDGFVPGHTVDAGLREPGDPPVPGGVGPEGPGPSGLPEEGYNDNNDNNDNNNDAFDIYGDACEPCTDCEADCTATWFNHCAEPWWHRRCRLTCNSGCDVESSAPTTPPTASPDVGDTASPITNPTQTSAPSLPPVQTSSASPTATPTSTQTRGAAPSPAPATLKYKVECIDYSVSCSDTWQTCTTAYWRNWCKATCLSPNDLQVAPSSCNPVTIPTACAALVDSGSNCKQPWVNGDLESYSFDHHCHAPGADEKAHWRTVCPLTCCLLDNNLLIPTDAASAEAATATTPTTATLSPTKTPSHSTSAPSESPTNLTEFTAMPTESPTTLTQFTDTPTESPTFDTISTATNAPTSYPLPQRVLVGYYPQWAIYRENGRRYDISDIPTSIGLTHLNYAFINVDEGICKVYDANAESVNLPEMAALRTANPGLKIMASLGGWTLSAGLSTAAATPESRATLVESCLYLVERDGFDGIDLDWEYPGKAGNTNEFTAADKDNFTLLLKAFRTRLDEIAYLYAGEHYPLTIATSAVNIENSYDVPEIIKYLDFINVMTYDFHGAWDSVTDHAPFESGSSAGWSFTESLEMWLAAGTPKHQLVAGFAFYGRSVKDITSTANDGLGQPFTCRSGCTESGSFGTEAVYEAKDLIYAQTNGGVVGVGSGAGGGEGFEYHWDEAQSVPWLFNPTSKTFISFDNKRSICIKAKWAHEQGLRGGMFWEIAGDDGTLQKVVADIFLKGEDSIDCDTL